MKKLETKTIYWGFPVCLLSTLNPKGYTNVTPISSIYNVNNLIMIGINTTSKAYENIKLNKKLILNVVPSNMWEDIEKIANYTSSETNINKTQNFIENKLTKTNLKLVPSNFGIDYIQNTTLYIEAIFEDELVKDGMANVCLSVKNIYANSELINNDEIIDEVKFGVLIYQFRKYKKINTKELGKSFRYSKTK